MSNFDSNGNYNKTNWKTGDKITADKLNKIEESLETINDKINDLDGSSGGLEYVKSQSFIDVKDYGAKGDGVTDDTNAFLECINEAIRVNKAAYVPSGVYILAPTILDFKIADGQSFILKGDGSSSILKRKDQTLVGDWQRLFRIMTSESNKNDVELVRIENLKIDGNATNQQEPPADNTFAFEHSASFYIMGCKNSRINNVQIENVIATDGVADHIYIPGSGDSFIDNLLVNNFVCDYRNRTRSDLCVTGWIKTAIFTNIKCTSLEYEINNGKGFGVSYLFLNNIEVDVLDLASVNGILGVYGSNIVVKQRSYLTYLDGRITNSLFTSSEKSRYLRNHDLCFDNCKFIITTSVSTTVDETSGETVEVYTLNTLNTEYFNNITFLNCSFKTDEKTDYYDSYLIQAKPYSTEGVFLRFDSCTFDNKVKTALYLNRSGTCIVENCVFYNDIPITLNCISEEVDVTLRNIKMLGSGQCLNIMNGSDTYFRLRINNMVCSYKNAMITTSNSSGMKFVEFESDRKIFIDEPVTKAYLKSLNANNNSFRAFSGDEFINVKSKMNEPSSWKVVTTGIFDINNIDTWLIAEGTSLGVTDDRPTCYLHKGYQYFDTVLGKYIVWNGESWAE